MTMQEKIFGKVKDVIEAAGFEVVTRKEWANTGVLSACVPGELGLAVQVSYSFQQEYCSISLYTGDRAVSKGTVPPVKVYGYLEYHDVARLQEMLDTLTEHLAEQPKPIRGIKKWIRDGNDGIGEECGTFTHVMEHAGRVLDKHCSHDIMGEILFEGDDGKMYVGCVEFVISEASADYVKDVLAEEPE